MAGVVELKRPQTPRRDERASGNSGRHGYPRATDLRAITGDKQQEYLADLSPHRLAPGLAVWQDVAWRADPDVGLKRVGSAHLGWNDGPALANAIGAGVTPGLSI